MAIVFKTIIHAVTINSMFYECSAVHLHSNALQVILVHGAAVPTSFHKANVKLLQYTPVLLFSLKLLYT